MKKNQKLFSYQKILSKEPVLYEAAQVCYGECTGKGIAEQTTSYLLAPMAVCFTGWVLKRAQSQGIRRLYFLARDGYQFYKCAVKLCEVWNLPLECRYLKCSRYSLRIPMFAQMGEKALDYICLGGMDVTFTKVMQRAGIFGEDALQIGKMSGFEGNMERTMSYQQVQGLKSVLKKNEIFMERMQEISNKAYPAAEAYLRQEGLFENISYAIVDSGWTGSMQQVLQQMLLVGGCRKKLRGFYWGLYELPAEADAECYESYYFKVQGDYRRKVHFSNCLFESVFSAPHGMTIAYCEENGKIEACYDREKGSNAEKVEYQTKLLIHYVKEAALRLKTWSDKEFAEAAKVLYPLQRSFMGHPSRAEAEWYGSYRFSDDVLEEIQQPVAAVMSKQELKNNHVFYKFFNMYGMKKGTIQESAWYEASAVLGEGSSWWHQKQYQWYKYLIYIRKNIKMRKLSI